MRYPPSIALLVLLLSAAADGSPYPLDFREGHTLKEVFDSGLRPWRSLGLELTHCEFGDCGIALSLPGCRPFSLSALAAHLTVIGGTIDSITFDTDARDVQSTLTQTQQICEALGIQVEGLEAMAAQRQNTPGTHSDWSGKLRNDRIRADVSFRLLFLIDRVIAEYSLVISFLPPGRFTGLPAHPSSRHTAMNTSQWSSHRATHLRSDFWSTGLITTET